MASKAMDLFLIYEFLKRLTKPFEKWDAFEAGVIDKNGKVLVDKRDRSREQEKTWGYYDRLVANLKKLLMKIPGGKKRVASFAAALLLLREEQLNPDNLDLLAERLEDYMSEAEMLVEDEGATNTAGGGKIDGIGIGPKGEPGVDPKDMKRRKKKNKELHQKILARKLKNNVQ